jgi:hypothetical protein
LPDDFIKANTSDLNRVKQLSASDKTAEKSHFADLIESTHRKDGSTAYSIISDLTDLLS